MPIIIDGNKQLNTPVDIIIGNLRSQLEVMGIHKLGSVEYKGKNLRVQCPIHKGGQENTPSCNILLNDSGELPAGTTYCFACGYRANIVKLCSDCMCCSYRKATEWLLGFVDYDFIEDIRDIHPIDLDDNEKDNYDELPKITIDDLKSYDYIHPYMFKRKLNEWAISKFEIGYDPSSECLTFPVYVDDRCLFVARRKVNYKKFIMPKVEPKPIYGLPYITDDEVIVCESILNAITCWIYGRQAIALFGTGSKWQIKQLKKLPQRKIILALDNDEAGRNGTYKIKKALSDKIVTTLKVPFGRDINDLTKEEFDNLEELI